MRKQTLLTLSLSAATALALTLAGCGGTSSVPGAQANTSQQQARGTAPDAVNGNNQPPPSEIINQYDSVPSGPQPTNFELVFSGNLVTAICGPSNPPCTDQQLDFSYDPFCGPSQGTCEPDVSYNQANNSTTVEYSGPELFENVSGSTNFYHFGLLVTPNQTGGIKSLECTSYWSYPSAPNSAQPCVSIGTSDFTKTSKNWAYALAYISVSTVKGGPVVYGTWNEIAYIPKGTAQPHLTFQNYGKQTLYVASSGIITGLAVPKDPECQNNPGCPENMQILSTLTFEGAPPPGQAGSQFVPLTYPPASILKPAKN